DSVAIPVESPVATSPAEPGEEPDTKADAEHDSRSRNEQPRIPVPSRPGDERRAVHDPGIVLRHVYDLRVRRFDDDLRPLLDHLLLRRRLQVARLLGAAAHHLDGVNYVLLM